MQVYKHIRLGKGRRYMRSLYFIFPLGLMVFALGIGLYPVPTGAQPNQPADIPPAMDVDPNMSLDDIMNQLLNAAGDTSGQEVPTPPESQESVSDITPEPVEETVQEVVEEITDVHIVETPTEDQAIEPTTVPTEAIIDSATSQKVLEELEQLRQMYSDLPAIPLGEDAPFEGLLPVTTAPDELEIEVQPVPTEAPSIDIPEFEMGGDEALKQMLEQHYGGAQAIPVAPGDSRQPGIMSLFGDMTTVESGDISAPSDTDTTDETTTISATVPLAADKSDTTESPLVLRYLTRDTIYLDTEPLHRRFGLRTLLARGQGLLYGSLNNAIAAGDLYAVIDLIRFGDTIDLNVPDSQNRLPIHHAIMSGHEPVVRELIAAGAQIQILDHEGNSVLHIAAMNNQPEILYTLWNLGAHDFLNARNNYNHTPISLAAERGNTEAALMLAHMGADIDTNYEEGTYTPPVILAARNRHFDLVKLLRRLGPDYDAYFAASLGDLDTLKEHIRKDPMLVNTVNRNNETPVHHAVAAGEIKVVQYLIDVGAALQITTNNNDTPMSIAVNMGHYDLIDLLIQAGISINYLAQQNLSETVLHLACRNGNVQMVNFLLSRGADMNRLSRPGLAPLHVATLERKIDVVETLTAHNAQVDIRNYQAFTPLMFASERGYPRVAEILLNKGANVNLFERRRYTPLHLAVLNNQHTLTRILLENNANVDQSDLTGSSPLHYAADAGLNPLIKTLVQAGASCDLGNNEGHTPLHLAALNGHRSTIQVLLDLGANINARDNQYRSPVYLALEHEHFSHARMLVNRGADIMTPDNLGSTLLHHAAKTQNTDAVDWLLFLGLSPTTPDLDGNTPLHFAAADAPYETLHLLLEKDANVTVSNAMDVTPLHYAAARGVISNLQLLLNHRAHILARDNQGRIPLHYAAASGNLETIELLIQKGGNVNLADAYGFSALHLAAESAHPEIVVLLLKNQAEISTQIESSETPLSLAHATYIQRKDLQQSLQLRVDNTPAEIEPAPALLEDLADAITQQRIAWRTIMILEAAILEDYALTALHGDVEHMKALVRDYPEHANSFHYGLTPLHLAARHGHVDCVQVLLDNGADYHLQSLEREGYTPVHEAALAGHEDVLALFLAKGASDDIPSALGLTVLELAKK